MCCDKLATTKYFLKNSVLWQKKCGRYMPPYIITTRSTKLRLLVHEINIGTDENVKLFCSMTYGSRERLLNSVYFKFSKK